MVYSMTGYGRHEIEENNRKVSVEITAVNHRYCDINIRMPRTLSSLEEGIRTFLKQHIARGKIEVNIYCFSTSEDDVEVLVNETLAKCYLKSLRQMADSLQIQDDITVSKLVQLGDIISVQKKIGDIEEIEQTIKKALEQATKELLKMRMQEGETLKTAILEKAKEMEKWMQQIEMRSDKVVIEYKTKLEQRIHTLAENVTIDPNRLATEVALFADRCSIDEEITRLHSHIGQLRLILEEKQAIGRKLDFLVQEMNREANTIGSKANDYTITQCAVQLKTEIEKIREQIQNIE